MNLDLGVYYPIKVGEGKELRLTGDWFNVFNSQRAVTFDQTFSNQQRRYRCSEQYRIRSTDRPYWFRHLHRSGLAPSSPSNEINFRLVRKPLRVMGRAPFTVLSPISFLAVEI